MLTKKTIWIKIAFVTASLLIAGLFVTGIIQTFVLKSYENKNEKLLEQKAQLTEEYNYKNKVKDYHKTREYIEEYYRARGYGKASDVLYK